jgi:rhomboid protease GluP
VGVRDEKCYTCGRANPGLWGFGPMLRQLGSDLGFAPLVIGACSAIYLLTLLASGNQLQVAGGGMSILSPSSSSLLLFGMSGAYPVYVYGWWWTLLSASWLHGGLIHILFNMLYVRQIGPATAEMIGPSRTVIVYVVSGVTGFFLSSTAGYFLAGIPIPILHGAGYTMGASASIFGLLGALVHYGRKSGSSLVHGQAMQYAIFAGVFGLIFPGVDNYAHLGGFLGGYVSSWALNPLTRERGDHVLIAIGLLVLSALSIGFAVLHGLGILGS